MISFEVNDMTCGHCVNTITRAVRAVDPGARLEIDLAAHLVHIEFTKIGAAELADAVRDAGYTPVAIDSSALQAVPAAPRGGCCCS